MGKEVKTLALILFGTFALIFLGIVLLGRGEAKKEETVSDTNLLVKENSNIQKAPDEKAVLVEFGDYQCPACAQFDPFVENVKEKYKDNLTFVFRHFPLQQHNNSTNAAIAAEASGKMGKFWEMHKLLYEKQEEWSELKDPKEKFMEYAKELELNEEEFGKLYDEKINLDKINTDKNDAILIGVNSTPTFYLDGKKLDVNPTQLDMFVKSAIDSKK